MSSLSEVCKLIVDCPHSTARNEGEGYPLIRTPNIGKGRFNLENVHRVSEEIYNIRNTRAVPQDDDLILAREAPAGNVAIIKNGDKFCLGQRTVLIRPDKGKVNPDFLVYYLLSPEQQNKLLSQANGSTVDHVNLPIIRNLQLSLPPLPVQKRIASILSAYDDLIENNQKHIKLLEEAAQRLYKEWFVDLRFPGHESVKVVDGVPEGWKIKKIEELADTMSGGTPTRSHEEYYSSGEILWLKTKELNDGFIFDTEEKITEAGLKNSSAKLFEKGCIILAMYGATIGRLGISSVTMCCNQACCVLKIKEIILFEYVYLWLVNNREMLISRGRGSAQSNLSQELIKQIEVRIPSDGVLIKFSNVVDKLLKNKEILEKQISSLREARDRLLPKLMSGEIEV